MADDSKKRESKVQRIFVDDEGEAHSRATLNTKMVVFKYADGQEDRFDLSSICPNGVLPEPSVLRAAAAFGVNTSAGNLAGPLTTADEIREAIGGRLELFAQGAWATAREGGDRPSDLLEAWTMFRSTHGADISDEWKASPKGAARLKDEDFRDNLAKEPEIKAHLADIRAKRAAAKAAEARALASTGGQGVGLD